MEIVVTHTAPVHVLSLAGRWDSFTAQSFEDCVTNLIHTQNMRLVVLDLAQVDYISSFGLRSLLNLSKLLEPREGAVYVAALRPNVKRVFVGSGFDSLFPAYEHADAALTDLKDLA